MSSLTSLIRWLRALTYQPTDWRVARGADGKWWVEWEHPDQGWVMAHPPQTFDFMVEAAAHGRRLYERK